MSPEETLRVCRMVKALCPQQAMDEYTPDAWHFVLNDLRWQDCHDAIGELGKRQHFISPDEIRAEVKRIRHKRIMEHPPLVPPSDLTDEQERAWTYEARRRIGDGEVIGDARGVLRERVFTLPDLPDASERVAELRAAIAQRKAAETPEVEEETA